MGIIELQPHAGLILLKAHLFIYGAAANGLLAQQIAKSVNDQWNKPAARIIYKQRNYLFVVRTKGFYTADLRPGDVWHNDDPLKNYFRVEEFSRLDISFVDGLGSNTGYFKRGNLHEGSTTAAHEFGHTLGLDHPLNLDIRHLPAAGIMYPRGTLVGKNLQYDAAAMAGAKGGTLNPDFRNVTQQDVDLLNIPGLEYNELGLAVLGNFSNTWHDAHLPGQKRD